MIVACPTCKKSLEWSTQNEYRPFCSERCKLLDLGAWADGSYSIPDDELLDPNDYIDSQNNKDEDE